MALIEPVVQVVFDLVNASPRDRIMRMAFQKIFPRDVEVGFWVFRSEQPGGYGPRFRFSLQILLDAGVLLFDADPRRGDIAIKVDPCSELPRGPPLAAQNGQFLFIDCRPDRVEPFGQAAMVDGVLFENVGGEMMEADT